MEQEMLTEFQSRNLEERKYLGKQSADGRRILNWCLRKQGVRLLIEFHGLAIASGGGIL
jgi:hypothetical protein